MPLTEIIIKFNRIITIPVIPLQRKKSIQYGYVSQKNTANEVNPGYSQHFKEAHPEG